MRRYEYKLVPAPDKATKHKGLKGAANFAATLEDVMNAMGAEGWTYLRADILPEEVRSGLTSRTTTYRTILVFQRDIPEEQPDIETHPVAAVPVEAPEPDDADGPDSEAALANLFAPLDDDPDEPRGDDGRPRVRP